MPSPHRLPVRPAGRVDQPVGPLERTVRTLAIVGALLFAGHTLWPLLAPGAPPPTAGLVSTARAAVEESGMSETMTDLLNPPAPVDQHFTGCNAARAAGRENIPRSDPSYRDWMDGDQDGWACEPYRR